MAQVPYTPYPEVEPKGIPDNAHVPMHVNPDMFGAGIGRALSQAGNTFLDLAQTQGHIQNELTANDATINATSQMNQRLFEYQKLEGRGAVDSYDQFSQDIRDINKQAVEGAKNPQQQQMLSNHMMSMTDRMLGYGDRHRASQLKVWHADTNQRSIDNYGNQAIYGRDNDADVDQNVEAAGQQRADFEHDRLVAPGAQPSKEVEDEMNAAASSVRGKIVKDLVETLSNEGKMDRALAIYQRWEKRIDMGSVNTIAQFLHGKQTDGEMRGLLAKTFPEFSSKIIPQPGAPNLPPPIDAYRQHLPEQQQGQPNTQGAIGQQAELKPIALSDADKERLALTVAGEAGGQSKSAQEGVAWVLRNRLTLGGEFGKNVDDVTRANQWSSWGNGRIDKLTDEEKKNAREVVDRVFGGKAPDPTKGATHSDEAAPSWSKNFTKTAAIDGENFWQDPRYASKFETQKPLSPGAPPATLIATTREAQRTQGPEGYGDPLHGTITINGHTYNFQTGGHGRGSIPFGTYQIGGPENHPYLHGTAFPLSNVYDPFVKDTRSALFIHQGRGTAGCIGIDPSQWAQFEQDMRSAGPKAITIGHPGVAHDDVAQQSHQDQKTAQIQTGTATDAAQPASPLPQQKFDGADAPVHALPELIRKWYAVTENRPDLRFKGEQLFRKMVGEEHEMYKEIRGTLDKNIPHIIELAANGNLGADFPGPAVKAYYPEKYEDWQRQFVTAQVFGKSLQDLRFADNKTFNDAYADLTSGNGVRSMALQFHAKQPATGPGAAGASPDSLGVDYWKLKDIATKRVEEMAKERQKALLDPKTADPVLYLRDDPSLQQRVKAFNEAGKTSPNSLVSGLASSALQKTAAQSLAGYILRRQADMGVPEGDRHILTRAEAQKNVAKLTSPESMKDPVTALRRFQSEVGDLYPLYYKDLVQFGNLPSGWQAMQFLDDENAKYLGKALMHSQKAQPDGEKGANHRAWDTLFHDDGAPAKQSIDTPIDIHGDVKNLERVLAHQGFGPGHSAAIIDDIKHLAYGRRYYAGEDASTAVSNAVKAFTTGKYDFWENSAVPLKTDTGKTSSDIRKSADSLRDEITGQNIQMPYGREYNGHLDASKPAPEEYATILRHTSKWVTSPDSSGLMLTDQRGQYVKWKDGSPVYVSFNDPSRVPDHIQQQRAAYAKQSTWEHVKHYFGADTHSQPEPSNGNVSVQNPLR